jgi:hypothetical protein
MALWITIYIVIYMKGKPEYIILNYLYQFHDFYRAVNLPPSLRNLVGEESQIGIFQHTVNELIDAGFIEPRERELYRITLEGMRKVEQWERKKKEEDEERNLRRDYAWESEDEESLMILLAQLKHRAAMALWMSLLAMASVCAVVFFLVWRRG